MNYVTEHYECHFTPISYVFLTNKTNICRAGEESVDPFDYCKFPFKWNRVYRMKSTITITIIIELLVIIVILDNNNNGKDNNNS